LPEEVIAKTKDKYRAIEQMITAVES